MDQASRAHESGRGRISRLLHWTPDTDVIQRALANQPWKEYTSEGGRKYWYNTETKASSWEMPEVYKSALAQSQPAAKIPPP